MRIEQQSALSKTTVRYTTYTMVALLLAVLDVILLDFISVGGLTPDLLLILVVWITLSEGQFVGLFAAFACGILYDVISVDIIGSNALAKVVVALIAGWFWKENSVQQNIGSYRFLIIVLISSIVHNLIYFFMYIKYSEINFLPFFLKYGIAISLYTTVFAIFPMLFKIPRNRIIR
jgi:rod shape-determining protein MreD